MSTRALAFLRINLRAAKTPLNLSFATILLAAAPVQAAPGLAQVVIQPPLGSAIAEQAKIDSVLQLHQLAQRAAATQWELARDSLTQCKQPKASLGFSLHAMALYPAEYREAARQAFGFEADLPAIWTTAPDGPSDWAGLRAGDTITAINGESLASAQSPGKAGTISPMARAKSILDNLPVGTNAEIRIMRAGIPMGFSVTTQPACSDSLPASAASGIAILSKDPAALNKLNLATSDSELSQLLFGTAADEITRSAAGVRTAPVVAALGSPGVPTGGKGARR
jgi:hypothetical protein